MAERFAKLGRKSKSVPVRRTVKFKVGSGLTDSVNSVKPADLKKLDDELVTLTVKSTEPTIKEVVVYKSLYTESDTDVILNGVDESSQEEPESLKAKFVEDEDESELK